MLPYSAIIFPVNGRLCIGVSPYLCVKNLLPHWPCAYDNFLDLFPFFIAGNESCPQPQTSEHLAAIEIMKLKHIIILQNKIDLVKESQAKEQYDQILKFVQGRNKHSL